MCEVLIETHPEYAEIKHRLEGAKMILKKVLKFETPTAILNFDQEKNLMAEHLMLKAGDPANDKKLQIVNLFHGTTEAQELVKNEGLDIRTLNRFGHFGAGIYFSDNPAFARLEAESDGRSKVIYWCKVILGNSMVYPKDEQNPSLKREPRTSVGGRMMIYDSVEGNISGLRQFVVYEKRRTLVQYAIEYETSEPLPTLPKPTAVIEEVGSDSESVGGSDNEEDGGYKTPNEEQNYQPNVGGGRETAGNVNVNDPSRVIKDILAHLMSIKGSHNEKVFDELLTLFYKTYIQSNRPIAKEVPKDKIKQFREVTNCTNEMEAKIFLAVNDFNIDHAINNYYTTTA